MSAIVQLFEHSLTLPFFGIGVKTDHFQSCGHCWVFQICWRIEYSTFTASAAAAELLQSCLTLCDPTDSSSPGSPIPGILQARTLEWVAISFSNAWKWKGKVKSLSHALLSDPMDCSLPGSSILSIWNSSTGIPSPPRTLFVVMFPKAYLTSHPGCLAQGEFLHILAKTW